MNSIRNIYRKIDLHIRFGAARCSGLRRALETLNATFEEFAALHVTATPAETATVYSKPIGRFLLSFSVIVIVILPASVRYGM